MVIVGGGILGTMHALVACQLGHEVVHLEADAGPRRASVRNFGLVWVSGRAPGEELDLALRSRARWAELAGRAPGIGFRPDGSLTLARHPAEWSLMEEAAARPDAGRRGLELLGPEKVRAANPAVRGDVVGGLLCRLDAVVEPGRVLGAVRDLLAASGRYRWVPARQVVDVVEAAGSVTAVDHLGGHHPGSRAVLCVGDRLTGLGGRVGATLATAPLRRCRLQMLETAPAPERLPTALADADTMRYYPAFALPGRGTLPEPASETAAVGMQLLCVQRAGGRLTIGDTHVYEEPFDFATDQHLEEQLRSRAEALLGWSLPPTARRWAGVYTGTTDERICYRQHVAPGVTVVTGPAGRGMTLAPAIAEQTWEELVP